MRINYRKIESMQRRFNGSLLVTAPTMRENLRRSIKVLVAKHNRLAA